jgi:hypothetical protein
LSNFSEKSSVLCGQSRVRKKQTENPQPIVFQWIAGFVGPSDWIRTSGLLNPIQARYQTSPHPDKSAVQCQLSHNSTLRRILQEFFSLFLKNFPGAPKEHPRTLKRGGSERPMA